MNRTTWMTVTREENGKYYAYTVPVTESDNIVLKLGSDVIRAYIMPTKEKARKVARALNEGYENDGTYIYDWLRS